MRVGAEYHQLNDVFYVLSEYNSRQEILTKYLTLYHVVENFMFKLPIVELERQRGGRMFSIRDFQRLYDQIDDSEMAAIRKLFSTILLVEPTPGITFKQHMSARWDTLIPGLTPAKIQLALGSLGLVISKRPMTHAEFKHNDISGNFAHMVYAIRNAVVHNKETEFHLTYATLDETIYAIIETFLIPTLEEVCFGLIGKPNLHVWYLNRELRLY